MSKRKKLSLYFAVFILLLVFFEGTAWLLSLFQDEAAMYDHRGEVLSRLDAAGLAEFKAQGGDPVLGWANFGPRVKRKRTCTGAEVMATIGQWGERTYPGYEPAAARVIAIGDSFTNGAEAGDRDAYPARLAARLGVSVANHGVGGYGPVQALLNLEDKLPRYPGVKVAVLGIMYENLFRMVNRYRPVLNSHTGMLYGLKPYMRGGVIRPHPGTGALVDIAAFSRYASRAFDQDFWAKPVYGFPYSWSLLHSLSSHYFIYLRLGKKNLRKMGLPDFAWAYRSETLLAELFPLLRRFTDVAAARGVVPAVVFIPANPYDTESAASMIERNRGRFPAGLLVGNVGAMEIDWTRFNLRNPDSGDYCHPSSYGYDKIAEFVTQLLEEHHAL